MITYQELVCTDPIHHTSGRKRPSEWHNTGLAYSNRRYYPLRQSLINRCLNYGTAFRILHNGMVAITIKRGHDFKLFIKSDSAVVHRIRGN